MAIDHGRYGIPSEANYVAAYCRRTGRGEIQNWRYYVILSLFRLAAIAQGVDYRGIKGNAASPAAIERGHMCRQLSTIAWDLGQQGRLRQPINPETCPPWRTTATPI